MPLDIYLRIPTDPNYDSTQLEVDDRLVNFVQMVEMILTTNKGEVFGFPNLGANLEAYLWNPHITPGTIKSDINKQIMEFCGYGVRDIPYSIGINFVKGAITDTMLVDIEIDGTAVLGIAAIPTNQNQKNNR